MSTHLRLVAVFAALGAGAACSNSPASPSMPNASGAAISGLVSGVSGGLTASVAGTNLSAPVDAAGRFELANVRAGDVRLEFRGGSTSAAATLANVANGQFIELQLQINGANAAIVSELRSAKVTMCHREDSGFFHAINISVNAEPAHLAHGDGKPGDPVPGSPTMTFSLTCQATGPGILLVKSTNGQDANDAPGPRILVGATVTWTYRVTNIGTVALTAVAVTDDQLPSVTCPATTLAIGASMTCTVTGTAELGPYTNLGTVTANWSTPGATPPSGTVTDTDLSHYLGVLTLDDDEGPKVSLCHRTGNGSFHLISVGLPAEPAHMAHGDGKPGGPVPNQNGMTFGPSCSIQ
jgi:uncharacterized repeat protein (TIGR01451 family)